MGYNSSQILIGQLMFLIGFLTISGSMLLLSPVAITELNHNTYYLVLNMMRSQLTLLFNLGANIIILCGTLLILNGVIQGTTDNPFNLFGLGLVMLAGGIGFFTIAGIFQWGSFINPLWSGSGSKPEAAIVSAYASIQLIISSVTIMKSLPSIFQEMIKLSKIQ